MAFSTLIGHELLHAGSGAFSPVLRTAEYVANWASPNLMPDAAQIMELGLKGWVSETVVDEVLLIHGISTNLDGKHAATVDTEAGNKRRNLWNQVYWASQELGTIKDAFTLANRGFLSDAELDQNMHRLGFYSQDVRARMANLRYEIPGSSDLVRFSVRHVFEPDLIERLGYNDEFRPVLDFWHRLQGLNYPLFSGPFSESIRTFERERGLAPGSFLRTYADAGLEDPTWAQAFWWSHWVVPSPSQAYEMYFRFRPDRNRAFDPPFTRGIDFGLDDLNLLLRANDYPPKLRPLLAGIAHRIPGIRFLRQLRQTGVFAKEDVKGLLLRQGYSEGDAEILAESVERNDTDQRRRGIEQQAKGQLAKYWELGAIGDEEYSQLLQHHGLSANDAAETIQLANLDLKFKRLQKIVDFVRRQMISGAINAAQATDQLIQAGVFHDRVTTYIQDWQLEVKFKHRQVAASKAVQWACKGFITIDDLRNRLTNLGYLPPDQAGLIAEAITCQQSLATRAASQQQRAAHQTERALLQQQKAAAQAIVAARRQLSAHGTPSQLRKWFCAGHIGQAEVYSRLRFLGWPDVDITRLISDCKQSSTSGKGGSRGGTTISGGQPPISTSPPSGPGG